MIVKITNFDETAEIPFIDYEISGLSQNQMDFLNENLDEETSICEDILKIRLYFKEVFPFMSVGGNYLILNIFHFLHFIFLILS